MGAAIRLKQQVFPPRNGEHHKADSNGLAQAARQPSTSACAVCRQLPGPQLSGSCSSDSDQPPTVLMMPGTIAASFTETGQ